MTANRAEQNMSDRRHRFIQSTPRQQRGPMYTPHVQWLMGLVKEYGPDVVGSWQDPPSAEHPNGVKAVNPGEGILPKMSRQLREYRRKKDEINARRRRRRRRRKSVQSKPERSER